MFQYAFAIATAKQFNTTFQLKFVHHKDEVAEWFDTKEILQPLIATTLEQWVFKQRTRLLKKSFLEEDMRLFYPELSNHCTYKGFFQNEQYFAHAATFIKAVFQLQPQWKTAFEKVKFQYDFDNSIVVHARLRDYITWGNDELGGMDLSLPTSYYINAMTQLGATTNTPVILISDDEAYAQERLSFLKNLVVFSHGSQLSFQAMLEAKRLVISNSTFAWWAAWLNPHQPQVIAPQHWLGFKIGKEYPHGILPASFSPVPVF